MLPKKSVVLILRCVSQGELVVNMAKPPGGKTMHNLLEGKGTSSWPHVHEGLSGDTRPPTPLVPPSGSPCLRWSPPFSADPASVSHQGLLYLSSHRSGHVHEGFALTMIHAKELQYSYTSRACHMWVKKKR